MGSELHVAGEYQQVELNAASNNLSPGELGEIDSNGEIDSHSSAPDNSGNGSALGYVIIENFIAGQTTDDDYSSGENVFARIYTPGSKVEMLVQNNLDLDGHVPLESNGDGTLTEHTGVSDSGDASATIADDLVVAYTPPGGLNTNSESEATLQEVVIA